MQLKIEGLKKPLYEERHKIISGEIKEFPGAKEKFEARHKKLELECANIVSKDDKEGEDKKDTEPVPVDVTYLKDVAGIPDFWFKAIKNNKIFSDSIKEKDEEILKHVKNIETERAFEEEDILTARFYFEKNEFFSNEVLTTKLHYEKGEDRDIKKIEGCEINWNEGKDVTKKKTKKKQKNKKTGETRTIVKTVDADSFFNIFKSREKQDGMESEEEAEFMDKMDEAMNIIEDFEDLMVPDGLEYYLGMNEDFDDGDDSDDDNDDGSEGD